MKKGLLAADWPVGLVVSALVAIAAFFGSFQSLERAAYDWGVRGAAGVPSDQVAILEIDERAIANIGRWPWPRNIHAELVQLLSAAEPKAIAYTVFFVEPQQDPGLEIIGQLLAFSEQSSMASVADEVAIVDAMLEEALKEGAENTALQDLAAIFGGSQLKNVLSDEIAVLQQTLREAAVALDTDSLLAATVQESGRVVFPFLFSSVIANPIGRPDSGLPPYVDRFALTKVVDDIDAGANGLLPLTGDGPLVPIEPLGITADGIGHLTTIPDVDGAVRTEALVLEYNGVYYPSFALLLAAKSLNLTVDDIEVRLGQGIRLGRLEIDTENDLQMRTSFYPRRGDASAFTTDSIFDVISGKVPVEKFKGKVILIGPTAAGLGDSFATPISPVTTPVELLANTVSSILQEDFFTRPFWAAFVEIGVFALIALFVIFLLPRLKAGVAAGITLVLGIILVLVGYFTMTSSGMWLQMMTPLALLVIGYVVLISKKFFITERGKEKSEMDSAESNKLLGLALQGQGRLDEAYEKFRKVPMGDDIMESLYNLALDYERKRQFNKAHAVYQYMSEHNPKFRDLESKMGRAKKLEETVLLGGAGGGGGAASTMLLDSGDIEKPMLGRYEVQKELGKGAMGVVYLGVDPKINRTVAIKTMSLSQEFEEDELKEVTERFFREAETAGRLNHPNIVTIYDAGEEHDLAYIAMEFLTGKDLTAFTKPDKLLPPRHVIKIVIKCAEALDYAHKNNVVHRDIKPANIMFDPKTGQLKVTDFGIARITDASRTKTGMVLGTPSYMSPEQLSGKKIDGRSDLFSLGVTLYQMLTGKLPFKGDSMATLMYQIANEPHPALEEATERALPPCIASIIDTVLAKDLNERYQTGTELAADLQVCLKAMEHGQG